MIAIRSKLSVNKIKRLRESNCAIENDETDSGVRAVKVCDSRVFSHFFFVSRERNEIQVQFIHKHELKRVESERAKALNTDLIQHT